MKLPLSPPVIVESHQRALGTEECKMQKGRVSLIEFLLMNGRGCMLSKDNIGMVRHVLPLGVAIHKQCLCYAATHHF
jgi:hypothetical protein